MDVSNPNTLSSDMQALFSDSSFRLTTESISDSRALGKENLAALRERIPNDTKLSALFAQQTKRTEWWAELLTDEALERMIDAHKQRSIPHYRARTALLQSLPCPDVVSKPIFPLFRDSKWLCSEREDVPAEGGVGNTRAFYLWVFIENDWERCRLGGTELDGAFIFVLREGVTEPWQVPTIHPTILRRDELDYFRNNNDPEFLQIWLGNAEAKSRLKHNYNIFRASLQPTG